MNGFVQLLKNLKYLTKISLKKTMSYEDMLTDIMFRLSECKEIHPKIYSPTETIKLLQETNCSLARFGDGEINLIKGQDIPYQKYDETLAKRLKEILFNEQENLLVGINHWYFEFKNLYLMDSFTREFSIYTMPLIRKKLLEHINWEKQYCSAEISEFLNENNEQWFNEFRKIWQDKEIVVVACKESINNYKYNIFDNAKKIDYVFVPNKDSFSNYENVLNKIKEFNQSSLVILMAGPMSKVMASDLTYLGYRALDLGHLAKSYDYFKRGIKRTSETAAEFFSIDE